MMYFIVNIFLCFVLGATYAFGEMLSKFKNAKTILTIGWGLFYLAFNGGLSSFAFLIIKEFNFDFLSYRGLEPGKVLMAGGSAMIVIRSWLISVRVEGKGSNGKTGKLHEPTLMPLIEIFLDYVKREFDRKKGENDCKIIAEIMHGLDFERIASTLPFTCSNLLIMMTKEDGAAIAKKVNEIRRQDFSNDQKLLNLGLVLNSYTGAKLLKEIIGNFREQPVQNIDSLIERLRELTDK
jgi:hypothetical protein